MASRENSGSTRGAAANSRGPAYQIFASTVVLVCGYAQAEADAVVSAVQEAGGIVQTRFSSATTPHVVVSCSVRAARRGHCCQLVQQPLHLGNAVRRIHHQLQRGSPLRQRGSAAQAVLER